MSKLSRAKKIAVILVLSVLAFTVSFFLTLDYSEEFLVRIVSNLLIGSDVIKAGNITSSFSTDSYVLPEACSPFINAVLARNKRFIHAVRNYIETQPDLTKDGLVFENVETDTKLAGSPKITVLMSATLQQQVSLSLDAVLVTDTSNNSVSTLDVNTEFWIYINITCTSGLDDLANITVWLYHSDHYSSPPSQHHLNSSYKWAWVNGEGWQEKGPDGTGTPDNTNPSGYKHIPGTCHTPSLTDTYGVWKLSFNLSKIAEDTGTTNDWILNVTVYNSSANTWDSTTLTLDLNFYQEISVNATMVTWDGLPGYAGVAPNGTTTYTFICNDAYNITAKGTDFTSGSYTIGVGNFTVDDDSTPDEATETGADELQLTTVYQDFITNNPVTTTEAGDNKDFWWFADIPSAAPPTTYTGTLYISVNDCNPDS